MTKSLSRGLRGLAERAGSGEAGLARLARIGLREMSLVLFLCLAAGRIWVFFEIADDMAEGGLEAFDTAILLALRTPDRKSVVEGKSVSERVDLGGRRIIKKQKQT